VCAGSPPWPPPEPPPWSRRTGTTSTAAHAIPAWAFVAAVAIHVATLAGRSEACLVLAAVTGDPLPRVAVHGANAAAFGAGIVQSQAALAVRVALLSRVERRAIRRADVALADVPIVAGTLATLGASGPPGSDLRVSSGSW